jgi:hypothetical protein
MKKSIITIAVAAVFTMGFADSEAWVFGKNNKQTSSEFLTAFGPAAAEFEGAYDSAKHLGTAINHPTKAGKPLTNCVKKLTEGLDAFKVKLAPNKLNTAVSAFGTASQPIASDPTIAQNKPVLINTVGGIHQRLSSLHSAAISKGIQNGTVMALGSFLQHMQSFMNMLNSVPGAMEGVSVPVATYTPTVNYGVPQPVSAAPVAAAPAPAARGR